MEQVPQFNSPLLHESKCEFHENENYQAINRLDGLPKCSGCIIKGNLDSSLLILIQDIINFNDENGDDVNKQKDNPLNESKINDNDKNQISEEISFQDSSNLSIVKSTNKFTQNNNVIKNLPIVSDKQILAQIENLLGEKIDISKIAQLNPQLQEARRRFLLAIDDCSNENIKYKEYLEKAKENLLKRYKILSNQGEFKYVLLDRTLDSIERMKKIKSILKRIESNQDNNLTQMQHELESLKLYDMNSFQRQFQCIADLIPALTTAKVINFQQIIKDALNGTQSVAQQNLNERMQELHSLDISKFTTEQFKEFVSIGKRMIETNEQMDQLIPQSKHSLKVVDIMKLITNNSNACSQEAISQIQEALVSAQQLIQTFKVSNRITQQGQQQISFDQFNYQQIRNGFTLMTQIPQILSGTNNNCIKYLEDITNISKRLNDSLLPNNNLNDDQWEGIEGEDIINVLKDKSIKMPDSVINSVEQAFKSLNNYLRTFKIETKVENENNEYLNEMNNEQVQNGMELISKLKEQLKEGKQNQLDINDTIKYAKQLHKGRHHIQKQGIIDSNSLFKIITTHQFEIQKKELLAIQSMLNSVSRWIKSFGIKRYEERELVNLRELDENEIINVNRLCDIYRNKKLENQQNNEEGDTNGSYEKSSSPALLEIISETNLYKKELLHLINEFPLFEQSLFGKKENWSWIQPAQYRNSEQLTIENSTGDLEILKPNNIGGSVVTKFKLNNMKTYSLQCQLGLPISQCGTISIGLIKENDFVSKGVGQNRMESVFSTDSNFRLKTVLKGGFINYGEAPQYISLIQFKFCVDQKYFQVSDGAHKFVNKCNPNLIDQFGQYRFGVTFYQGQDYTPDLTIKLFNIQSIDENSDN